MRLIVITAPDPLLTWDEADAHLRLAGDETEKDLVENYIKAVSEHLDGPQGWLGRSIGVQTLEARNRYFDDCQWFLPRPEVVSVTSIKYLDTDGNEQLLDPAVYEVRGNAIVRKYGERWPSVRVDDENVRVRYQAGYADVPWAIKAAASLMLGDLFANRETGTLTFANPIVMSPNVESLLAPYRVWG